MARPKRIVLVRHGESEGNLDDTVYERKPDHALSLTEQGLEQARQTGKVLRDMFGDEGIDIYVSPYRRTLETLEAFELSPARIRVRQEPRLREQDWGNWQLHDDMERQRALRDAYGHFFYRFTEGESGADVYDRVDAFLDSLHRRMGTAEAAGNVLLVTHGLTLRLFCMRWFHWPVEYFESLVNPGNAEVKVLVRGDGGSYTLDRPFGQRSQ
ncbi:histidine phosphatase family protein [Streptomyces sp. NPDC058108]|uniref:histidine phosphatase family protein n=1 Tax=Streptomyces sp. NPDC058108 TaxID=3346344 RepID=UPI0036E61EA4